MSYNVRDPEIEAKLKHLARLIKGNLPDDWGFMLMLFSYGENGTTFYISSAQREDVVNVMKEFIQRNTQ